LTISVLVAGAGALGATIACELARRGAKVTVADPMDCGDNASGVAGGMLAPAFESLLDPLAPAFPLLRAARDSWPELAGRIGLTLDKHGALVVAAPDELDAMGSRLTALGARFRVMSGDDVGRRVPWLCSESPAIWTSEDWRLSPDEALRALRAGAEASGARWRRASVVRFEPGRADLSDGDRVDCDSLVIATGASRSLGDFAPELNVLAPIKGQILRWPTLALSGPVVRVNGAYVCPSPCGVAVGSTMEAGREDLTIDSSTVARLRGAASAVVPALAGGPVEARAGVRAATPDGLPLVGPAARPGVWLAVGARRNGWLLAPLIARITADGLAGSAPDGPAALFDPARFS
jgi:glycine oxidase